MSPRDTQGAVLTKSQREYLRGNRSLGNAAERNTRREIRNRIRQALSDFVLVQQRLSKRDREQIFEQEELISNHVENSTTNGIQYMLAFGYSGLQEQDYGLSSVERIIEDAIRIAELKRDEEEVPEQGSLLNVNVSLETQRENEVDTDQLVRRFHDGEPLNSEQLSFLLQNGHIKPEELVAYAGGEMDDLKSVEINTF